MGTQKGGYYTRSGTRVPGVTTVIGRFKESGALIHWAAGQSAEYIAKHLSESPTRAEVLKLCDQAKNAYRDVRDAAADAGTMAHAAVEAWINKQPFFFEGPPETVQKATMAFDAFMEWAKQTQLQVTHTEIALVSEEFGFGGTSDAMLINGKRSLGDWKTSNSVYPDYLCQLAAYGILWDEHHPDDPVTGGFHLLRFDKTRADFSHHYWGELDDARDAFLLMRKLYGLDPLLKARVK